VSNWNSRVSRAKNRYIIILLYKEIRVFKYLLGVQMKFLGASDTRTPLFVPPCLKQPFARGRKKGKI